MGRRCSCRCRMAATSTRSPTRWWDPPPRYAPAPSSAAMLRAIGSKARGRPHWRAGPQECEMSVLQRPQPRPGVLAIDPYVPGKSTAPGVERVFKLSSNETPLGPSPKAVAAYRSLAADLQDYPDGSSTALREAIARAFGLDPDRIVCGSGSDELLNLLADAYLRDGDEAIHTTHGFLVYPIATLGKGAAPVVAAEKNFAADVDAMLAAVTERTKVVFLANPNNPTGTYVPF